MIFTTRSIDFCTCSLELILDERFSLALPPTDAVFSATDVTHYLPLIKLLKVTLMNFLALLALTLEQVTA